MRLHLICINARATAAPNFCPHCTKEGGEEKLPAESSPSPDEARLKQARLGQGSQCEAGSESSEKCANLVTKLARYFNIFRFSAALPKDSLFLFMSLSFSPALTLSRTWYKSQPQPVENYDRCGSRHKLMQRFVRKFVKFSRLPRVDFPAHVKCHEGNLALGNVTALKFEICKSSAFRYLL